MAEAYEFSVEEFELLKLLLKIEKHDKFGMHLKYKTHDEVFSDPMCGNYPEDFLKRSTRFTKGKFTSESTSGKRYLTISSRYFNNRKHMATHRVLFMLYHDKRITKDLLVNHIDGNTFNNNIDNLELVSSSENSSTNRSIYKKDTATYFRYDKSNQTFSVSFRHKRTTYCFGVTKDKELAEGISQIFKEFKSIYDEDDLLIQFIEITKYKTLDERWSMLGYPRDSREFHNSLANIIASGLDIKQSGVRKTSSGFRVEIRIEGKPVTFGIFDSMQLANKISLQVRKLKTTNLTWLKSIITNKPKGVLSSTYFSNELLGIDYRR